MGFLEQAQARNQTLRYEPTPEPLVGAVDAERIGQVVTNLLGNALKFTPLDGSITLTSEREGDQVVFSVQDTGPGVPESHQARLFERFYQVDPSTTRQAGGLGLGLAIAKAIVEAHGGTIAYVPPPVGPGARFVVRLPLSFPPDDPAGSTGAS